MKITLFLLIFIMLITSHTHTMKRSYERLVLYRGPFQKFTFLPKDLQKLIVTFCTHRSITQKPKIATRTIAAFALTCKQYNTLINEPQFSDQLINNLTYQFYCSHETIAKFLNTVASNKRLNLQCKLKNACLHQRNNSTLDQLIKEGVNLEFTYNHKSRQKTPLMLCVDSYDNMFNYLLKTNININTATSHGLTALHYSTESTPLHYFHCRQLCQRSDININQRNNRGETALLRCLIKRKYYLNNQITFFNIIQELLKHGADPELGDKNGLTPLIAAKQLQNNRIIRLIEQAIIDKKSISS